MVDAQSPKYPRPMARLPALDIGHNKLPDRARIQQILDENEAIMQTILECQKEGDVYESTPHHQQLHRNLVYLAKAARMSSEGQPKEASKKSKLRKTDVNA